MADERVEGREVTWRQLLPWTELFRGFRVAMDLNKLLLAAAGIVVMAFGWWILSLIFGAAYDRNPPDWPSSYKATYSPDTAAWAKFKQDRENWNLMNEAANVSGKTETIAPADLAVRLDLTEAQYTALQGAYDDAKKAGVPVSVEIDKAVKAGTIPEKAGREAEQLLDRVKRAGTLSTWPWSEDRGPNPFLLVTGQTGIPWEPGYFWEWFSRDQFLVMIEPLVKMVRPIVYFFRPRADGLARFYFLCVLLWMLLTWSVFGGAITRIATVQVARGGEKIGMTEALRFTLRRVVSYLLAPIFPLVFIFFLLVFMVIYGWVGMIPVVGDIFVFGLFWPVMIIFGLIMAIALVGLVGWPLMAATISTEGTDSWEAVSRSYSYVYQRPWHYIWYAIVAIAYGAAVVFFVGFMGSLMVYLSKWGVAQTPWIDKADRNPSFLFAYAPTSFGWRDLLLEGVKDPEGQNVVGEEPISRGRDYAGGVNRWSRINPTAYDNYLKTFRWWNKVGAAIVTFWLGLLFLLILGFGYSYFWSASTIIYLLLRRHIDSAELDEVYLEEEEPEGPLGAPLPPPATPATAVKPGPALTMVEAPTLRPPVSDAAPAPAPMPLAPEAHLAPPPSEVANAPIPTPVPPEPPPERAPEPPPTGNGNAPLP